MTNSADPRLQIPGTPSVILRMKAVLQRTGLSRATIYRLMHAGEFPRSFKLGKTASGWLEAEVRAWIDAHAMARQSVGRGDYTVAA